MVHRRRSIPLPALAIALLAVAAFVVRPSLDATARSGAVTTQPTTAAPTQPLPVQRELTPSSGAPHSLGDADGVIAKGVAVSVFDDAVPAVGRLDDDLLGALRRAATDAAVHGVRVGVHSGWRSAAYQQQLLDDAVRKYGSPASAMRWVATPGTSAHVSGDAVDVGPSAAAAWLSRHGAAYGLCQIYANEPWHYELRPAAVGGRCPRMYADASQDPRLQSR